MLDFFAPLFRILSVATGLLALLHYMGAPIPIWGALTAPVAASFWAVLVLLVLGIITTLFEIALEWAVRRFFRAAKT
ncbi:hypothetical protein [Komagataeibacter sp. FNDCR2]|uniref:hypothetical protein n=1 Tax=Komagataeibacter sp. FNDCR2 TaxID=2878682 RepID=UPI001E2FED7A|nr:hypothetical protein [Komagataeibacter sp. FNDCR2]MCE2576885.1 hypothetical protein [Komagataeibacter sp. FNDCR2]